MTALRMRFGKNRFTAADLFSVVLVLLVLAGPVFICFFIQLGEKRIDPHSGVTCVTNLSQLGKALAAYQSSAYFGTEPYPEDCLLEKRNTPQAALLPIQALFRCGLLDTPKLVACPQAQGLEVTDRLMNESNPGTVLTPRGTTNYLFTFYYQMGASGNQVIAGDASGDNAAGAGFSPNHGDLSYSRTGKGANALFADGHVKASAPDYSVEKAQGPGGTASIFNFWDQSGIRFDPKTMRTTGSCIAEYGK